MKNKKIIVFILVFFLILLGIAYGIFNVVDMLKKDAEQAENQMREIDLLYEQLNDNAILFNEKKKEYDALMKDIYYTTVPEQNDAIVKVLKEYDEIIANIQKNGNQLNEKCDVYYNNSETNQKCSSYKISYESAMTLFIADLRRYNTLVNDYNEWTKENIGYQEINTYVSKNVE